MVERKPVQPPKRVQKQKTAGYVESSARAGETPQQPPAASSSRPSGGRRKRRVVRVPFSTRVRIELREAMDAYELDAGLGPQTIVEEALVEYLGQRGYAVAVEDER